MKYQEYENWTAINVGDFRANMAEVIEAMEDSGVPIIITRRNVPLLQVTPVSLRAYRSVLRNMEELQKRAAAEGNEDILKQLQFSTAAIRAKIAELTDDSKKLLRSQADLKRMMTEAMPLFQQYLNSSEDSAMVGTNTSADEAEADKQGKRSVVSPAKSVKDQQREIFKKTFDKARKKTSAKGDKSPPTGGKSSEGDSFEYRMKA